MGIFFIQKVVIKKVPLTSITLKTLIINELRYFVLGDSKVGVTQLGGS